MTAELRFGSAEAAWLCSTKGTLGMCLRVCSDTRLRRQSEEDQNPFQQWYCVVKPPGTVRALESVPSGLGTLRMLCGRGLIGEESFLGMKRNTSVSDQSVRIVKPD